MGGLPFQFVGELSSTLCSSAKGGSLENADVFEAVHYFRTVPLWESKAGRVERESGAFPSYPTMWLPKLPYLGHGPFQKDTKSKPEVGRLETYAITVLLLIC